MMHICLHSPSSQILPHEALGGAGCYSRSPHSTATPAPVAELTAPAVAPGTCSLTSCSKQAKKRTGFCSVVCYEAQCIGSSSSPVGGASTGRGSRVAAAAPPSKRQQQNSSPTWALPLLEALVAARREGFLPSADRQRGSWDAAHAGALGGRQGFDRSALQNKWTALVKLADGGAPGQTPIIPCYGHGKVVLSAELLEQVCQRAAAEQPAKKQ